MEPFSIVCKSCAARLKVTKASAVGQILACPKCGTMIEVAPPKGWVVPKPANVSDTLTDSSGSLGGDFEDIEQLLAKPQAPSKTPAGSPKRKQRSQPGSAPAGNVPAPANKKKKSGKSVRPTAQSSPAASSRTHSQPVLPTDQWTSEDTRKRKRIVRIVVGLVGSLLLLAVIVAAIIFNFSKPETSVATNDAADASATVGADQADPVDPSPENAKTGQPQTGSDGDNDFDTDATGAQVPDNAPGPDRTDVPETDVPDNQIPVENSPVDNQTPEPKIGDVIDTTNPPPLTGEEPDSKIAGQSKSPFNGTSTKQEPSSPFKVEPPTEKPTVQAGMVEALDNDLGELSSLLEQRGTSLSDFQDIAAQINNQQLIGLPKYSVLRSEAPLDLDLEKRLGYPIGGLIFNDAPLSKVLRSLSAISGIPISIDARSIVAMGKNPNQPVTITISQTDVAGALGQILAPMELSKMNYGNGIVVGILGSQAMSKAEYDLPEIPGISDDDRKGFVAVIREFVSPPAWVREQDPATIELVNNSIVVNCSEQMQAEIERLLSKLKSAVALIQDPSNSEAIENTQSRWKSISSLLSKDPELTHSVQSEIEFFLNRLESQTGVAVLVDWPSVMREGWTPQTVVPGNIFESSVLDTVQQLAQSMRLSFQAVNENTMVLTTFESSAQRVDLEVYPISKLLADNVSANQIMNLVNNALGSQLQSKAVRYVYQPKCQCIVVLAPQTIQRQIEALINQLGGI